MSIQPLLIFQTYFQTDKIVVQFIRSKERVLCVLVLGSREGRQGLMNQIKEGWAVSAKWLTSWNSRNAAAVYDHVSQGHPILYVYVIARRTPRAIWIAKAADTWTSMDDLSCTLFRICIIGIKHDTTFCQWIHTSKDQTLENMRPHTVREKLEYNSRFHRF